MSPTVLWALNSLALPLYSNFNSYYNHQGFEYIPSQQNKLLHLKQITSLKGRITFIFWFTSLRILTVWVWKSEQSRFVLGINLASDDKYAAHCPLSNMYLLYILWKVYPIFKWLVVIQIIIIMILYYRQPLVAVKIELLILL
jgi:hypothetical protein